LWAAGLPVLEQRSVLQRQVPLALIRQCLSRIGHIVPTKE